MPGTRLLLPQVDQPALLRRNPLFLLRCSPSQAQHRNPHLGRRHSLPASQLYSQRLSQPCSLHPVHPPCLPLNQPHPPLSTATNASPLSITQKETLVGIALRIARSLRLAPYLARAMRGILKQALLGAWAVQFAQEDTTLLLEMKCVLLAKRACIPRRGAVTARIVLQEASRRPLRVNAACVPRESTARSQAQVTVWRVRWAPSWQKREPPPSRCVR